jgi:hypothetical protein
MLACAAGFGLVVDLRPASRRLYGRQGYNGRHAANMAPNREAALHSPTVRSATNDHNHRDDAVAQGG